MPDSNSVYECLICGYIYEERREDCQWSELPPEWQCPQCGAPKSVFEKLN